MIDILLTILIAILLGFIYLKDRAHEKQLNQLIKAIIAKHSTDYTQMTLSENTNVNMEPPPNLPQIDDDLVPVSGADSDLFDRMVNSQLEPDEDDQTD